MSVQYRHSQPGYLMIIVGLILIAVAVVVYASGPLPLVIILSAAGIFILVFGYKLTVEIKDGFLRFWFGPRMFWKKIAVEQIAYCQPFKGVVYGWGIRIIGDGWLYNVSGMKAVTIVLKSGRKIHIGTDEPQRLIEAVNAVLRGAGGYEASQMWAEVKADYLQRVEQALSAARHPRSFEILADVSNHLDRRFVELGPQEHNWENFQKIVTEMGPPSEYAELVGDKKAGWFSHSGAELISVCLLLVLVAFSAYFYPRMPDQMTTHWDIYGQVNGYMPKLLAMLMMPITLTGFVILVIVVPRVASVWANIEGFRKFFGDLLVLTSVFMLLIQCHIVAWNLDIKINPAIVVFPMIAAIIVWVVLRLYRARRQN